MDQQCSATVKHWTMSNFQNVHLWPKSPPISGLINDRLSVNQNADVASTYQHPASDFDRSNPVALPRLCNHSY